MAPGWLNTEWIARQDLVILLFSFKLIFYFRHHTVRAHVKAYRLYEKEFKAAQEGKVGITMNTDWYEPETDSEADQTGQFKTKFQFF